MKTKRLFAVFIVLHLSVGAHAALNDRIASFMADQVREALWLTDSNKTQSQHNRNLAVTWVDSLVSGSHDWGFRGLNLSTSLLRTKLSGDLGLIKNIPLLHWSGKEFFMSHNDATFYILTASGEIGSGKNELLSKWTKDKVFGKADHEKNSTLRLLGIVLAIIGSTMAVSGQRAVYWVFRRLF